MAGRTFVLRLSVTPHTTLSDDAPRLIATASSRELTSKILKDYSLLTSFYSFTLASRVCFCERVSLQMRSISRAAPKRVRFAIGRINSDCRYTAA